MKRLYQVDRVTMVVVVAESDTEAETIANLHDWGDVEVSTDVCEIEAHVPESVPWHLRKSIPWGDSDGETAEKWLAKP